MLSPEERYRGCLFGLAAGDALGVAVEFMSPGSFKRVSEMLGRPGWNLAPGDWTDDTSMALCLAESLVIRGRFDAEDQMLRYLRWYEEGYMSSTGTCFDIGNTTRDALLQFKRSGQAYAGSTHPHTAGNGSLMRLAPVPMFFATDAARAMDRAGDSSRTTHAATEAVDGCRLFALLIVAALSGLPKEVFMEPPVVADLAPRIAKVAAGSYKRKQPPEIRGTGYVVESLEAALWAFWNAGSFEEALILAVNLGEDADTTGAICGQIAGAYYGYEAIPDRWKQKIAMHALILDFADRLLELAGGIVARDALEEQYWCE